MPVVTDAGPLIALAKLNLLHLLKLLYIRVEIAEAVYDEVVTNGLRRGREDARVIQQFLSQEQWVTSAIASPVLGASEIRLDQGELASINLALTLGASLLMDEEHGRDVARQHGISVKGTLGILVQAYRNGFITADQFRLYINQIAERSDIWISPTLCSRVLREVLGAT